MTTLTVGPTNWSLRPEPVRYRLPDLFDNDATLVELTNHLPGGGSHLVAKRGVAHELRAGGGE